MAKNEHLNVEVVPLDGVCVNCYESLGAIYIRCAQCKLPRGGTPINLCTLCFSTGVELVNGHKRDHDYRVINVTGPKLFNPTGRTVVSSHRKWGLREEISLLETVDRFNLGNWDEVVRKVAETSGEEVRSALDVKSHYDRFYIRGRVGRTTLRAYPSTSEVIDLTDPVPPTLGTSLHLLSAQVSPPVKEKTFKQNADDLKLLAYMPYRDDFEKEWDNEAEDRITGLDVQPDDDECDRALSLAAVDRYLRLGYDRRRRKALSRDYLLVPQFLKSVKPEVTKAVKFVNSPFQASREKDEKSLRDRMKKFSQFLPLDDFDDLVVSVMKKNALAERIKRLQRYQSSGITSLHGRKAFNVEEIVKPKRKRRKKKTISFQSTQQKNVYRYMRWRKYMAAQADGASPAAAAGDQGQIVGAGGLGSETEL